MLKSSEMQHQYWITKKTVQRKLGSKEDEHIISSDASLDAKIEIFKSISDTSAELSKIVDQYQERISILSQEETIFGRFLKDAGKRSKTTGQSIVNTAKGVSYCGQQRMCIRVPLLRLQHEVNVFKNRAVCDTQNTITHMEKERTEYRAALGWMKSASAELDPDSGRGLNKFRTAQTHVRAAKQNFDSLSMDSIQKIDLLAAARCNMFSHVMVSYMTELLQFAQKTSSTLEQISKVLDNKPKYDFCVLKDLSQNLNESDDKQTVRSKISPLDKDQSLFFADDYADNNDGKEKENAKTEAKHQELSSNNSTLIELSSDANDDSNNSTIAEQTHSSTTNNNNNNLLDDNEYNTNDALSEIFLQSVLTAAGAKSSMDITGLLSAPFPTTIATEANTNTNTTSGSTNNGDMPLQSQQKQLKLSKKSNSKNNRWADLFSDLDPLANLEEFDQKIIGKSKNIQQT